MTSSRVQRTKSGVFVRNDHSFGLLVFSPYTGLFFACNAADADKIISWLECLSEPPSDEYASALGPGWYTSIEDGRYPSRHLLPSSASAWPILLTPEQPILINWLITGNCPLSCRYCYAEDLMRGRSIEPDKAAVARMAKAILSFNPIAVVITGGDPLASPFLEDIFVNLHDKTGLILDTSGYGLKNHHLDLFQQFKVAVRVSLDSERPRINDAQRTRLPDRPGDTGGALREALRAICSCLDNDIAVSVQTVATKTTANDLRSLGNKLFRMGIRSWRIFKVASSSARIKGYNELIGTPRQKKSIYKHAFTRISTSQGSYWGPSMDIQTTRDEPANAVILVAPDGTFYTESNVSPQKVVLDEKNPKCPALKSIVGKIDLQAHARRYLNMTSE